MTDAFKSSKANDPININKPVKQNRTLGFAFGPRVSKPKAKRTTTGKTMKKANGTRSGVMLPPAGKQ